MWCPFLCMECHCCCVVSTVFVLSFYRWLIYKPLMSFANFVENLLYILQTLQLLTHHLIHKSYRRDRAVYWYHGQSHQHYHRLQCIFQSTTRGNSNGGWCRSQRNKHYSTWAHWSCHILCHNCRSLQHTQKHYDWFGGYFVRWMLGILTLTPCYHILVSYRGCNSDPIH